MRERLPNVGAVFAAGDIDYRTFTTIVYRTDLITDPDVLGAALLRWGRWPPGWIGWAAGAGGATASPHNARPLARWWSM
jgi:Domain of unknown function (DUF222)